MSTKRLFAQQAFALTLGSLGIAVKPEAVTTTSIGDEIDCLVLCMANGSSCLAEDSFSGDEDGGYIVIRSIDSQRPDADHQHWFAASDTGRPIPIEEALAEAA